MMGILGSTYFTERMFSAMDKNRDNKIDLEEYITYNNVILNGSIIEKREQNFAMINDNKDDVVSKEEFQNFVINILDMYSKADREKIERNKGMIDEVFEQIAPKGKDEFNFDNYMKALNDNPDLFVWLERPKEMLSDILHKEETQYSKKVVDELIELFFKYIGTTEVSMRKILRSVKMLRGDSDIESISEHTNYLLNIQNTALGKGRRGYYDIVKKFTKDEADVPAKFGKKSRSHNTYHAKRDIKKESKSISEEEDDDDDDDVEDEGEDYQDSDEEEDSDEELKGNDDSMATQKSASNHRNSNLDLLNNKKLEKELTKKLRNDNEDPLDNIQNIAELMIDVSQSLDTQARKLISHQKENKREEIYRSDNKEDNENNEDNEDDLPQDREFIDFGHERFDLVFNIMLGIKRSID